jgi:hypothetical protein
MTRAMEDSISMTRARVLLAARITGHIAWWIFIVATLFAGGITWLGLDDEGVFSGPSTGWTAYTPLTDATVGIANFTGPAPYEWWTEPEVFSAVAFAIVIIAAVTEAVAVRRVVPAIVTVVAPVVALGILIVVTPGVVDSWQLGTMTTMGAVLLAVAVREFWARRH